MNNFIVLNKDKGINYYCNSRDAFVEYLSDIYALDMVEYTFLEERGYDWYSMTWNQVFDVIQDTLFARKHA